MLAEASQGFLLKKTLLAEEYVLGMLVLLALASWLVMRPRLSERAINRAFIAISAAWFIGATAMAVADLETYRISVREDHLSEWVSAEMLLLAAVLGIVAIVRLARRGKPAPMAVFLSGGCLLACVREMEFGRPFFGAKVWYSRNLFRLQAYLDPDYIRKFTKSKPITGKPLPLYPVHLIFSAVLIFCVVIAAAYVIHYRKPLIRQVRRLAGKAYGRYLLLGVGGYVGTQAIIGKLCHWVLACEPLAGFQAKHHLDCSIVSEPVEAWAAACLLLSVLMFWRSRFRPAVVPLAPASVAPAPARGPVRPGPSPPA